MRAEPPRLAVVGGCAFERQRCVSLERRHRRLKQDEHLGGALEGERLDAGGNGAEARDQAVRPAATVASVSAKGSGMAAV